MFDIILKAIKSLFNKCEKRIAEVAESLSWNNLKDKPFGTVREGGYLLPLTTLEPDGEGYALETPLKAKLEAGAIYTVNCNGVGYQCPCKFTATPDGKAAYALGDIDGFLGGESNGMPFVLFVFLQQTPGNYGHGFISDGAETMMVFIYGTADFVKKIPEEYLPETRNTFYADLTTGSSTTTLALTSDITFDMVLEAIYKGKTVYLRISGDTSIYGSFAYMGVTGSEHDGYIFFQTGGGLAWLTPEGELRVN